MNLRRITVSPLALLRRRRRPHQKHPWTALPNHRRVTNAGARVAWTCGASARERRHAHRQFLVVSGTWIHGRWNIFSSRIITYLCCIHRRGGIPLFPDAAHTQHCWSTQIAWPSTSLGWKCGQRIRRYRVITLPRKLTRGSGSPSPLSGKRKRYAYFITARSVQEA